MSSDCYIVTMWQIQIALTVISEKSWDLFILAAASVHLLLAAAGNNNYIFSKVKNSLKELSFHYSQSLNKNIWLRHTEKSNVFRFTCNGVYINFLQIFKWFRFLSFSDFCDYQEIMMTSKPDCCQPLLLSFSSQTREYFHKM